MMLNRTNLALLAALLVLIGLDLGLRPGTRGTNTDSVLEDFEPAEATTVALRRGDEACTLVRTDGTWRVRERDDFMAQQELVDELLLRLAAVNRGDVVSVERDSQARLGIDEDAVDVLVTDANDRTLVSLRAGRAEDATAGSHLVFDGDEAVYRAATIPLPEPEPSRWIASKLVDLTVPAIRVVRVQRADGELHELVLQQNGTWNLTGGARQLAQRVLQPVLLVATTTFCEDVVSPPLADVGLDPPHLRVELVEEGGRARSLELGGRLDGRRALRRGGWRGPWVALVRERSAANLEAVLTNLLAAIEQG